jgi:hypothetical protein
MASQYGPRIVTDGLIAYYDAGNTKSYPETGTVFSDISGNNNNGTLTNGPTYSSLNKGAIILDGSNDYISTNLTLPSPTTTPTTFDIIFKNNSSSTFRGFLGLSSYQVSGFALGFYVNSLTQIYALYNTSGADYIGGWNYNSSVISHGVFVFNARSISCYRNGALVGTITSSIDATANSGGIQIGRILQGGWGNAQCDIYSLKIYNKVLSSSEVSQNYNATKGRFGL